MIDNDVQFPNRFRLVKVPGTDDIFDIEPVPGKVYSYGSPLNKNTFLKDATAALYGKGPDALPDEILAFIGQYNEYWWRRRLNAGNSPWEYLRSSARHAYPDDGIANGYKYEYLGVPFNNAVTAPKIATGSYVGTGEKGPDKPNSLTFDFNVKALFIYWNFAGGMYTDIFLAIKPAEYATQGYHMYSYSGQNRSSVIWNGNTVSWHCEIGYSTNNDGQWIQMNAQNQTYYYLAIG